MFKIPKPEYTVEFKELAVKRVKDGQGENKEGQCQISGCVASCFGVRLETGRSLGSDSKPHSICE
jgi:hypothetical protein